MNKYDINPGIFYQLKHKPELIQLIDDCLSTDQNNDEDFKEFPKYQILDILNETEHGRKRLYQMLSSKDLTSNVMLHYDRSQIYSEYIKIVNQWLQDEDNEITTAERADTNIKFSWSSVNKINDTNNTKTFTKNSSLNQKLYKRAFTGLKRIHEESRRNEIYKSKEQENTKSVKTEINSTFKMDPLEKFVAYALPTKPKTKKTKRKSLLWFWPNKEKHPENRVNQSYHVRSISESEHRYNDDIKSFNKNDGATFLYK